LRAGARRVAQYEEGVEKPDPSAPGREEFVEALKNGATYKVWLYSSNGCRTCNGDGSMSTLQGGGICKTCHGAGDSVEAWLLKWR